MKTSIYIEFSGKQFDEKSLITAVKKEWSDSGNKVGDIKTLQMYIKPEDQAVYYVINETNQGKLNV